MVIKRRKVLKGLKRKGFIARENDHTYLHLIVDGKKQGIHTKLSHGNREIGDPLLSKMAGQLKLNKYEFEKLIECPISKNDYLDILDEKEDEGNDLPVYPRG